MRGHTYSRGVSGLTSFGSDGLRQSVTAARTQAVSNVRALLTADETTVLIEEKLPVVLRRLRGRLW